MDEETGIEQETNENGEQTEFEVDQLNDENLDGVAGGVQEPGGGCTINSVANC